MVVEADAILVVVQLVAEVTVTGSLHGTDDGNALRQERNVELLVHVDDTLVLQSLDYLLPAQRHFA